MSFVGFANYYREFIKSYEDKVYPMQQLMRHKGKKLTWNKAIEESFQRTKRELCEAPVLEWHVCPKHRRCRVRDIWHTPSRARMERQDCHETNSIQEQNPERPGDKYGALMSEMFAVVTFVEKYSAYLDSEPFKGVDRRSLSYSIDQSYSGRWIVRLDCYKMIIEHKTRDKHQNEDSLSKKRELYKRQEQREADRPEIKDGFLFMDKETNDTYDSRGGSTSHENRLRITLNYPLNTRRQRS